MKIYFVRHGETDWNKERKIQGQVDIPLNEFGRTLARKTGAALANIKFDICISSPLGRAKETAELILGDRRIPILEDKRIQEMGFGVLEGKCCSKEGWDVPDSFHLFFEDPAHYKPSEGGEDFQSVKDRTGAFLEALFQKEAYQDSKILITTHGAALCGMLNYIYHRPLAQYWGVGVHKNCAVTEVEVKHGKPVVLSENRVYYDDEVEAW